MRGRRQRGFGYRFRGGGCGQRRNNNNKRRGRGNQIDHRAYIVVHYFDEVIKVNNISG